jgi:hypothetical protein
MGIQITSLTNLPDVMLTNVKFLDIRFFLVIFVQPILKLKTTKKVTKPF